MTEAVGGLSLVARQQSLAKVSVDGYDPIWLVSKHADIMEIERQPQVFTSGWR